MANSDFLKRFEVTEYRNNIDIVKSKETNRYFYVEDKNGYYIVYDNYNPVVKQANKGKEYNIYTEVKPNVLQDFITELDVKYETAN